MVKIHVPEDVGGELRNLPESTYEGIIKGFKLGTSKTDNPKLTMRLVVSTEMKGRKPADYQSTVGETILMDYALTENAIWNLNDLYKKITGERLPMGDYEPQEFAENINNRLAGVKIAFEAFNETYEGVTRTKIRNVVKL